MNAQEWNRRYESSELVWTAQPNRFLVPEVEGLAPGRALDLACGEGRHAVWLAERGWQVTAVDFSDVAIAKGRQLAAARGVEVEWVVADLTQWEARAAFDLVLVFYLQLPAEERRAVFAQGARAVGPGGTFVLVGHDRRNLTEGHGGPSSPEVLYTPEDVVADLAGSGLEVERAEPVRRTVQTAEGERFAIDALVRARRG